jgi:hypothetical protein
VRAPEDAATVEAADEVTAAALAQSLATITAADEVALEAAGEARERVRAASIKHPSRESVAHERETSRVNEQERWHPLIYRHDCCSAVGHEHAE